VPFLKPKYNKYIFIICLLYVENQFFFKVLENKFLETKFLRKT